jgi:hypothetical protein
MNNQPSEICPRCSKGRLRDWNSLGDEEREIVRRLPASADYAMTERQATHRWCTNCWYEATENKAEA